LTRVLHWKYPYKDQLKVMKYWQFSLVPEATEQLLVGICELCLSWRHEIGSIFKTGNLGEIFQSKQQMTRLTSQSIINNKHIVSHRGGISVFLAILF
jgi:hypothetical protein